ncbi:type IV pilus assembly protein PilM [Catenuloplanes nepalensis]|uniref:Type IV pilus assembly protein PilM n=1 Tax=Catenuloplanes nepalensis TaxID=587533 RepID=A0ABT9MWK6_9ACTN|nr:type IV pilus assembly protein PilM [Catenuloplanes nepalensis]MDP9795646.1 type IV pilus assembly protein PilM [Catenuloplanes nepalensis]
MAATNLIGLDIGSMSVRAVETTRTKQGLGILNYAQAPLPAGAVVSGVVRDDAAVTAALKELWTTTKFRSRHVTLGVTNPQAVVREMSVAKLPRNQLKKSLPFQVRDMLPLAVERALLDFYPLEEPAGDTIRGLLIAAPKDAVLTAVRAVERAGLFVDRVDLASFALLRAASWLDTTVEAIVDIGAQATSVVVHANGEPLIVRTVPRGGQELTELLAGRLGIGATEAEAVKCWVGLRTQEGPEVAELLREGLRPLISEIRSSFTYLSSSERPTQVQRLSLSGGGSLLPGLPEMLAYELSVATVIADPMSRLRGVEPGQHDNLERFRSSAAVSIGLTLGAA